MHHNCGFQKPKLYEFNLYSSLRFLTGLDNDKLYNIIFLFKVMYILSNYLLLFIHLLYLLSKLSLLKSYSYILSIKCMN